MPHHQLVAQVAGQAGAGAEQCLRIIVGVEDPPHQRKPVSVHPAGRDPNQAIAEDDAAAVEKLIPLSYSHHEAGEVEVGIGVDAGELSGFAADESATSFTAPPNHPTHQHFHAVLVQRAEGHVIQEEKRPGALGEDVVDVEGHEILANALEMTELGRYLELGTHAVGAGDEDWIPVAAEARTARRTRRCCPTLPGRG